MKTMKTASFHENHQFSYENRWFSRKLRVFMKNCHQCAQNSSSFNKANCMTYLGTRLKNKDFMKTTKTASFHENHQFSYENRWFSRKLSGFI